MIARPTPRPSRVASLAVLVLYVAWVTFVVATPVLGAWVASSLAAYSNGPVRVAAATGLLLFPVLPVAWEGWATLRRRRRGVTAKRFLTWGDRLILRTLTVNLLFLGAVLGARPAAAFAALSTRGDWMLDGRTGTRVDTARHWLFRAADRLEWLYLAVHVDTFAEKNRSPAPSSTPSTTPSPAPSRPTSPASSTPAPSSVASSTPTPPPSSSSTSREPSGSDDAPAALKAEWPLAPTLHPAVASMPASVETSIESVAGYLADREKTPEGRLKAAHDWVADRIAYDVPSYRTRRFPPQDAKSVFDARTGVCAGYSALFGALASALGFEVVYVSGDARTEGMDEKGEGHAWNAVRMGDRYVLVDTTWDSGTVKGDTFTKRYITDYYETPPEVFSSNHFPSDARWQLRGEPISRGDFFRQAMMTPRFYAQHRELVSPTRSQVTVRGPLEVLMRAPARLYTSATWSVRGREERTHCEVTRGELVRVTCALPAVGAYTVNLFSNEAEYGTYEFVGEVEANREE